MQTTDGVQNNIGRIAELFPECITECKETLTGGVRRAIDFDKLRQILSSEIVEGREERYQFTWPDKRKAILAANAPVNATLRPCREESVNFDTTQNLYIEGDNLDVLKCLKETYLHKVKMIYIDPPYNTGNDFVYEDNFAESTTDYLANSGQFDEQGNRMVTNTESNGRFHTDWLNMIYPRLKVARDLLSDDGVIFISIDDNEVENLRKVCDEIFGRINYLNTMAWITNITGRQISGTGAAKTWESILVYAKDIRHSSSLLIDIDKAKGYMPDAYKGFNKDIREDSYGKFAIGDTLYNHNRKFNEETRPNLVFSIFYNPETEEIKVGNIGDAIEGFVEIKPHKNGDGTHKYHAWRWSRQKVENESYDLIALKTSAGSYEMHTRIRNFDKTLLKDLITNVSNGNDEVIDLFNGKRYFDYPKSVALLKILVGSLELKDSLILDFFSGSATTAHAVMQLNAEDGGNRKFIMVQLPELTDEKSEAYKAGYKNICEIGMERIRRAGKKIKEDSPLTTQDLDTGFRVLKLDSTNMEDIYYSPMDTDQRNLFNMVDNVKPDRTSEDLLFQVMLELGATLDSKIEETTVADKTIYNVADNYLVACFDQDVTDNVVTAIAKMQPMYAVLRDTSMKTDSTATNFEQIFKTYSPNTVTKIL